MVNDGDLLAHKSVAVALYLATYFNYKFYDEREDFYLDINLNIY
jgi:hypothetical protein